MGRPPHIVYETVILSPDFNFQCTLSVAELTAQYSTPVFYDLCILSVLITMNCKSQECKLYCICVKSPLSHIPLFYKCWCLMYGCPSLASSLLLLVNQHLFISLTVVTKSFETRIPVVPPQWTVSIPLQYYPQTLRMLPVNSSTR